MIRLLLSAVALGIGTDLFILHSDGPGLGCFLFILVYIGALLVVSGKHKEVFVRKDLCTLGALLILGSLTLVFFDSAYAGQLATLGVMSLAFLFFIASAGFSSVLPLEQYIEACLHLLDSSPRALAQLRTTVRDTTSVQARKFSRAVLQIIIGLVILLPVGSIFLALFTGADPVFRASVQNFFTYVFSGALIQQVIGHAIYIPIFFLFWLVPLAVVRYVNMHSHKTAWDMRSVDEKFWIYIVLGGLVTLFGIFLGFQGFYLFGGADAFHALDLTYAEYAKQGFGQLIAVTVLVLGIASAYHMFVTEERAPGKILLSLIVVETFAVLISALVRLTLYVDAYGLTASRHAGYWGLAMVAGSLLATLILTWISEYRRLTPAVIILIVTLGSIAYPFLTPDRTVAQYNVTHTIPYSLQDIRGLSNNVRADGLPVLLPYLDSHLPTDLYNKDTGYATLTKSRLCGGEFTADLPEFSKGIFYDGNTVRDRLNALDHKQPWFSWNLARQHVRTAYTAVPSWVNLDSPEHFAAYCGR